ncbi:cerebellar degeneration-related protein 2-like [Drosophila gunungcola]|uniref:cerebellar degeneration-related protein 2-like n=1 Tax=Drosophila gunungcola TaxID=103775 RepID=UPI0022E7C059|nr:cerebellar degeneration-related protein 2-like [Drosophila gunungcola]
MEESNSNHGMAGCENVSQFMLDDLQLAAELGKTLLERNKELETFIKEYKIKGDEQELEILHLRKHINAMTEVNDSRLKVYEQLEVGIQDLERANQRLNMEKNRDKKQIKSLTTNTEILEARCEELNQLLSDARQSLSTERRKVDQYQQERYRMQHSAEGSVSSHSIQSLCKEQNLEISKLDVMAMAIANSTGVEELSFTNDTMCERTAVKGEENEELVKLLSEMEIIKRDFLAEQQRCTELEEQLVTIIQDNQGLQSRLLENSANEGTMSMHEEFSLLDDVRQGQMCSRCLRDINESNTNMDDQSSIAPTEEIYEDDDRSIQSCSEHASKCDNSASEYKERLRISEDLNLNASDKPNPYRDLVEKYEALVEVKRTSNAAKSNFANNSDGKTITELSQSKKTEIVVNSSKESELMLDSTRKRTPTEFSESETTSSGFSDETSNKCTQTDERPSFFLCSISNGNDCKFSIYDDVSPIESHFRNRPEYRELFKEIFGVLKKAADNNEVDKLPSLQDDAQVIEKLPLVPAKVPPVTPEREESPDEFIDDTQSVVSSIISNQSIAMSECVTKLERKTAKKHIFEVRSQQNHSAHTQSTLLSNSSKETTVGEATIKPIKENGQVLTPLKREPLEYLTVGVGIKKKNRRKHRNQSSSGDRIELFNSREFTPRNSPLAMNNRGGQGSSKLCTDTLNTEYGRSNRRRTTPSSSNWNGSPMVIYNKNMNTPQTSRGRVIELNGVEFYHNTVSQDLHKLKKLDLSYAEVLRRADAGDHIPTKLHSQRLQHNGSNIRKNHHQYRQK